MWSWHKFQTKDETTGTTWRYFTSSCQSFLFPQSPHSSLSHLIFSHVFMTSHFLFLLLLIVKVEFGWSKFKSWSQHISNVWPWANEIIRMNFRFLISHMYIITSPWFQELYKVYEPLLCCLAHNGALPPKIVLIPVLCAFPEL